MVPFLLFCIVLLLWMLLSVVSRKVYGVWINPVFMFNSVWLIPTLLSLTGIYDIYIPNAITVLSVCVTAIVFSFSSLGTHKKRLQNNSETTQNICIPKNTLRGIVLVNIVSLIWMLPYVIKMFPIIAAGDWALARSYYLNANTYHAVYTTYSSLILQWIIVPVIYASSIISAYLVAMRKPNYVLIILSAIGVLMIILATAGRLAILKILFFYVFAFFMVGDNKSSIWTKIKNSSKFVKLMLVVGIVGLCYITSQRKLSDDTTIMQNLYVYLVGPIPYLDNIFMNPERYGLFETYLYGRATFGFLTTPIEIALSILLGFDYAGADNIVTSYTNGYVMISDALRGNAFSTSIYPFLLDFGWLGLLIGPCIYGIISGFVYEKARYSSGKNKCFWQCVLVFIMYTVAFSEWQYDLVFPYSFSVLLILYITICKKNIFLRRKD